MKQQHHRLYTPVSEPNQPTKQHYKHNIKKTLIQHIIIIKRKNKLFSIEISQPNHGEKNKYKPYKSQEKKVQDYSA